MYDISYPQTPIQQYQLASPPYVPQVLLLPQGKQIVVPVCALLANAAGTTAAQTPARMYCYNVISSNGWQNTAFAELVKLACDLAVLLAAQTGSSPGTQMHEAVSLALTLYTSSLASASPQVMNSIDRNLAQNIMSNISALSAYQAQIASLYGNGNYGGHQAAHHGHQAVHGGNRHMHPVQAAPSANPAVAGLGVQKQTTAPVRQGRKTTAATEEPKPIMVMTAEIENMNRDAHAIPYFSKRVKQHTAPLRRALEESVEKHEVLADMKEMAASPYVFPNWVGERSLDEALNSVRSNVIEKMGDTFGAYLCFGIVVKPVISMSDMSDFFFRLSKASSFTDVANIITDKLAEATPEDTRTATAICAQLDRYLTDILNNFISRRLKTSVKEPLISSSFTEDVPALAKYLLEKHGSDVNSAYNTYQRCVLTYLFKYITAANLDETMMNLLYYGENVKVEGVAVVHNILYLNATSQELGLKLPNKKALNEVSAETTPLMTRLFSAVQKNIEKSGYSGSFILLTADDRRYEVYHQVTKDLTFVIREM